MLQTVHITSAVCLQLRANSQAKRRRRVKKQLRTTLTRSLRIVSACRQSSLPDASWQSHGRPQVCTQLPVRTYLSHCRLLLSPKKASFWIFSVCRNVHTLALGNAPLNPLECCSMTRHTEVEQMRDRWCRLALPYTEPESSLSPLGFDNRPPQPVTQDPLETDVEGPRVQDRAQHIGVLNTQHFQLTPASWQECVPCCCVCECQLVWCWQYYVWCKAWDIFGVVFRIKPIHNASPASFGQQRVSIGIHMLTYRRDA